MSHRWKCRICDKTGEGGMKAFDEHKCVGDEVVSEFKVLGVGQVWSDPSFPSGRSLVVKAFTDQYVVCGVVGTFEDYVTTRNRFEKRTDYTLAPSDIKGENVGFPTINARAPEGPLSSKPVTFPDASNPKCFGKQPVNTSHLFAEYDCATCPVRGECTEATYCMPLPTSEVVTKPDPRLYNTEQGSKHDQGKVRWSLLPKGVVTLILQVLEFGAVKYKVDNWQHVQDHERRYYDATMRHIEAWRLKETNDPESGLPHLAHAICCLMFLVWFDKEKK